MRTLGRQIILAGTSVFEEIRDKGLPTVIIHSSKYTCIAGYIIGKVVYDALIPKEEYSQVRRPQVSAYFTYCQNLVLLNEFCKEHNLTLIPYSDPKNEGFRRMFLPLLL